MFKFKPYRGKDKYHIRIYRGMIHPFIVTKIDFKGGTISGFLLTHKPVCKRGFYRLHKNPNSNDSKTSYMQRCLITDVISMFSDPRNNWHLSPEDEKLVNEQEKNLTRI